MVLLAICLFNHSQPSLNISAVVTAVKWSAIQHGIPRADWQFANLQIFKEALLFTTINTLSAGLNY